MTFLFREFSILNNLIHDIKSLSEYFTCTFSTYKIFHTINCLKAEMSLSSFY